MPRHDWTLAEVRALYELPLFTLLERARAVHRRHHPAPEVRLCTLVSVKTGGCTEDCRYCAQSSHHPALTPTPMLTVAAVEEQARAARLAGATHLCIGAAWRGPRPGAAFERVLAMVRAVKGAGLAACATLGLLDDEQARALREAGLDAYNHNLDTSRERYPSIVTTHSYDERLATLRRVRAQGIELCVGGIIGLGETVEDRCRLLLELTALRPHPEGVPLNALVPIPGTPLAAQPRTDPLELVRMVATARILLPRSRLPLAAGRQELGREGQLLALYAGADGIFVGDRLLTTGNPAADVDAALLRAAGLRAEVLPRVAEGSRPKGQGLGVSDPVDGLMPLR